MAADARTLWGAALEWVSILGLRLSSSGSDAEVAEVLKLLGSLSAKHAGEVLQKLAGAGVPTFETSKHYVVCEVSCDPPDCRIRASTNPQSANSGAQGTLCFGHPGQDQVSPAHALPRLGGGRGGLSS